MCIRDSIGVGGHPRIGDSGWIRCAGLVRHSTSRRPGVAFANIAATRRALSRFSAGSGADRWSIRMLHSAGRALLLCDRRDACLLYTSRASHFHGTGETAFSEHPAIAPEPAAQRQANKAY